METDNIKTLCKDRDKCEQCNNDIQVNAIHGQFVCQKCYDFYNNR